LHKKLHPRRLIIRIHSLVTHTLECIMYIFKKKKQQSSFASHVVRAYASRMRCHRASRVRKSGGRIGLWRRRRRRKRRVPPPPLFPLDPSMHMTHEKINRMCRGTCAFLRFSGKAPRLLFSPVRQSPLAPLCK
jgi:hypothetical protein